LKILGIDMGERRIGLALSDPLGITAQGMKTIQLKNPAEVCDKLMEVIKEKKVDKLVFGLPMNMNGTLGPQARKVQEFAQKIKNLSELPVDYEDERLSTVSAEQVLLLADQTRVKRKKAIDRLSAVIILQSYLDRKSAERTRGI
jgi:putative holliday junction resolvase